MHTVCNLQGRSKGSAAGAAALSARYKGSAVLTLLERRHSNNTSHFSEPPPKVGCSLGPRFFGDPKCVFKLFFHKIIKFENCISIFLKKINFKLILFLGAFVNIEDFKDNYQLVSLWAPFDPFFYNLFIKLG